MAVSPESSYSICYLDGNGPTNVAHRLGEPATVSVVHRRSSIEIIARNSITYLARRGPTKVAGGLGEPATVSVVHR